MPTRNVNLTQELDRFVLSRVKAGRYENASEVVRAGLRNLERDASGVAEGDVFQQVREALHLTANAS